MSNLAARVKQWFAANEANLAMQFNSVRLLLNNPDPVSGAYEIQLEGETLLVTIAIWFRGDISIQFLKEGSHMPVVLVDRRLDKHEDISELLDQQVREILRFK